MYNSDSTKLTNKPGWEKETVFYQIYPLGFCGAPFENDGQKENRIAKVIDWLPHLQKLNIGAVYFSPVFESDTHGYDTRDFRSIDCRLGSNEDFKQVCDAMHRAGIRVVLDGVFNHVGRGFWAFQDVLKNREASQYRDWFHVNFEGNSNYNDGLWYEGWEGHYELVKLNLHNPAVVEHILSAVELWMEEFGIDGLRLDVAYLLDEGFMRRLHSFCKERDPGFFLLGEMIHGDYNRIMNGEMLDSVTNYECYKGLHSSFNSMNMFEIAHSLLRQFGPENWTLYRGKHLFCFADNHDVSRIHTMLNDKEQLRALYAVLFCMPGIPCLYYGSEWGVDGDKKDGDSGLRPCFDSPVENSLTEFLGKLARCKRDSKALCYGELKSDTLQNKQWVMVRQCNEETVIAAINADSSGATVGCNYHGPAYEIISGQRAELTGTITLEPYDVKLFRMGDFQPEGREEALEQQEVPAEPVMAETPEVPEISEPSEMPEPRGELDEVQVVDYDLSWPHMFNEEARRLKTMLGENAIRLFHIGSTAVPGLKAKPIIDILCVVKDLAEIDRRSEDFESMGYVALGECGVSGRRYMRKGKEKRTHHLHIYQYDDMKNIVKDLAFCAYLKSNAQAREEYSRLKADLALEYAHDYMGYCRAKESFVLETGKAALCWYWERLRDC